jgi:2-haloacid dehalogenase
MEHFLATVCTPEWNLAQDRGRPWDEAIAELSAAHPAQAHLIAAYRARWPEMLGGAIDGTVAILTELHARGTPLYALTNWAADTWPHGRDGFPFLRMFRGILVSGEEGLIKPDPAIFRLLAARYGLVLTDCVFIDDNTKNAEAAGALGMHAIRFQDPGALRRELTGIGLLT